MKPIKEMKNHKNFSEWLKDHNACGEAREWVSENKYSEKQAWNKCKNPQWMLWYLNETGCNNDRVLRLFAVWCARQVQHLMTDPRSIAALDVAEKYANGKATENERAAAGEAGEAAGEAWEAAGAAWEAAGAAARAAARAAWGAAGAAAWAAAGEAWEAAGEARAAAGEAAGAAQAIQLRKMGRGRSESL
jgi:hypothetical protein